MSERIREINLGPSLFENTGEVMLIGSEYVKKLLLIFCLLSISISVNADDKGNSIMFQDQPDRNSGDLNIIKEDPIGDKCKQLSDKIESLEGKPQRRFAAIQEYNAQCTGNRN